MKLFTPERDFSELARVGFDGPAIAGNPAKVQAADAAMLQAFVKSYFGTSLNNTQAQMLMEHAEKASKTTGIDVVQRLHTFADQVNALADTVQATPHVNVVADWLNTAAQHGTQEYMLQDDSSLGIEAMAMARQANALALAIREVWSKNESFKNPMPGKPGRALEGAWGGEAQGQQRAQYQAAALDLALDFSQQMTPQIEEIRTAEAKGGKISRGARIAG